MMTYLRANRGLLLRSGLVGCLAFWLALAAGVNTAAAHAELAESNPRNGALLDEPPEQVSLSFTQELDTDGSSLAVFDQNGQQADAGNGGVDLNDLDHKRMVVSLPASLADGTYTARWTAQSVEDGDSTDGAISFTVGEPVEAGEASTGDTSSGLSPLLLAALVVGVLIVAGAVYMGRKRRVREKAR